MDLSEIYPKEFPDNFEINDDLYPDFIENCNESPTSWLKDLLQDWISMSPHQMGKINYLKALIKTREIEDNS